MSMNPSLLGSMGNGATPSGNSSNLLSSISSQGMPEEMPQESQEPTKPVNPAEQAIQRFGQIATQFESLIKMPEYASASQEANEVKRAMQNWLDKVVAATSKMGGESPSY